MTKTRVQPTDDYDIAAPQRGDKMRAHAYYDGYIGFLSAGAAKRDVALRVIDVVAFG